MKSKKRQSLAASFLVVLAVLHFSACDPGGNGFLDEGDIDGDGIPNHEDADMDGDGLSNEDELTYFTDPRKADTDGDGWNDFVELSSFSPTSDFYRFNPLVADIPRMKVLMRTFPEITMDYETTTGSSVSMTNASSQGTSVSTSTSNMNTNTTSMEHGWSVEVSAELQLGATIGGSFSTTVGAHGTYGSESSHSFSTEEASENTSMWETARGQEATESLTRVGGRIAADFVIKNEGNIAYNVDSLILTAYKIDYSDPDTELASIGTLSVSTGSSEIGVISPGAESGLLRFENTDLLVGDVLDLLETGSGIAVDASSYSISMTEGGETSDFTASGTNVSARTAKIIIDYGPTITSRSNEEFNVATLTNYNAEHTGLTDMYDPVYLEQILSDYLGISFVVTDGTLTTVRDITADATDSQYWYVVHDRLRDNVAEMEIYPSDGLDPSTMEIYAGDTLRIVLSQDADGDGLSARLEEYFGSSDNESDTDGDGLTDFEEVQGYDITVGENTIHVTTNPLLADTDDDGVGDLTEKTNGTNANSAIGVLYSDNFATGGSAPTDSGLYQPDDAVTVLDQADLVRLEDGITFIFQNWNTERDGTGTRFAPDDTLTMGWEDAVLFAQYTCLGQPGQVGLVFYDKGSYTDGWRYLEAQEGNQVDLRTFGTEVDYDGADGTAIGTGEQNTEDLSADPDSMSAANRCWSRYIIVDDVTYDDWFLPSKDELDRLHEVIHEGEYYTYTDGVYWTSSETSATTAWYQRFTDGAQGSTMPKSTSLRILPVRSF